MRYRTVLDDDELAREFLEIEPKVKKTTTRQSGMSKSAKTAKNSKNTKSTTTPVKKSTKTSAKLTKTKTSKSAKVKAKTQKIARKSQNLTENHDSAAQETVIKEAPVVPKLDFDPNTIINYQQLIAALNAKVPQVTLANDIMTPENILITSDVVINFDGFSIISQETNQAARVLDIRSGRVTLAGKGKIFAMGPRSVAIRLFGAIGTTVPDYTVLTVGEEISLFAPDNYGILISPNLGVAYGLTVNFAGRIFAHDGICLASGIRGREENFPVINIRDNARVTADEQSGVALEMGGYGQWQVSAAKLRAAVGASLRMGEVNFSQTQIMAANGPVFRVDDNTEPALEVMVDGGEYLSQADLAIDGVASGIKSFVIKDGEFCSEDDSMAEALLDFVEVEGGDFQNNLKETYVKMAENFAEPAKNEPVETAEPEHVAEQVENNVSAEAENIETDGEPEDFDVETIIDQAYGPSNNEKLIETEFGDTGLFMEADDVIAKNTKVVSKKSADTTKSAHKSAAKKLNGKLFSEQIDKIPELTDDATDEHEILLELSSEKLTPPPVMPIAPPLPPKPISEQDAARMALADAIADIRKLSAEDYDVGFGLLEKAIQNAEKILANPLASLADIRDAASNLLLAFDGLEERSELSMSDDELDELFYHGAVLEEMARPSNNDMPLASAQAMMGVVTPEVSLNMANHSSEADVEPDFTVLSDILDTISGINLNHYTQASQVALLEALDRAQEILQDEKASQSMVDEIAASLLAQISKLNPLLATHATAKRIKTSAPAPVVSTIIPATMIDEMMPVTVWSQGITMIDELAPFTTDATTREKMLRAMRPWVVGMAELATEPVRKMIKSIKAGARAGMNAYRETLRAAKN